MHDGLFSLGTTTVCVCAKKNSQRQHPTNNEITIWVCVCVCSSHYYKITRTLNIGDDNPLTYGRERQMRVIFTKAFLCSRHNQPRLYIYITYADDKNNRFFIVYVCMDAACVVMCVCCACPSIFKYKVM